MDLWKTEPENQILLEIIWKKAVKIPYSEKLETKPCLRCKNPNAGVCLCNKRSFIYNMSFRDFLDYKSRFKL